MTLSVMSSAPTVARDVSPTRESRGDDQGKDRFAGMLANAHVHAAHHRKPVPKHTIGTSELDATDAAKDDKETTGASDDETGAGTTAAAASTTAATAAAATATATAIAAGKAAASAAATMLAGPNGVVRSVAALDPELQAKLARVMDRMQNETGHSVTVQETYRSQSRQDALYAQGRDTAGPVVTWTENSKHTQGRAVDVVLDGGTASPDAYATLQRVANEEGLHTLGARDPGHLELPGSSATDVTSLKPAAPADASGPGQVSIANLAQVAQVADVRVAQPATVARVATVAQPGTSDKVAADPSVSARFAQTKDGSDKSGTDDRSSNNGGDSRGQHGGYAAPGSVYTMHQSDTATAPAAVAGSTAAERTDRILTAADNARPRSLSQITMNVDAGNGATDKIQVALRGNSLDTTIDVSDARVAQTMTARSDELVRALSRDGMEVESMRVRAVTSTVAPTAAPTAQNTSDSSSNSRFERGNPWQQPQRQQSQSDRRQQREQRKGEEQ